MVAKLQGRGEWQYDEAHDILLVKLKDREYRHSLEFQDTVLDVDSEGFITGMQIFSAAAHLGVTPEALREMPQFTFQVTVVKGEITVKLTFAVRGKGKSFLENAVASGLKDAEVVGEG